MEGTQSEINGCCMDVVGQERFLRALEAYQSLRETRRVMDPFARPLQM